MNVDEAYFRDPRNWLYRERALDSLQAPMGYSQAHIRDRVAQVDAMVRQVEEQIKGLERNIALLHEVVKSHLWVLPETSTMAFQNLAAGKEKAEALHERLVGVRAGFLALPTEEALTPKITQLRREAREADALRAVEAKKLKNAEEAEKKERQRRSGF